MTNRRDFLKAAAFSLASAKLGASANTNLRTMQGIFPIMQTPYADSGRLDTEVLAKEVKFLDKCGVHGVVWPQLASEWSTLEPDERTSGAEAVMTAAKGGRCAVVLGVQGPDVEGARRLGHHAGGPLRRSVRAALELLASRQARKGHGGPFAHFIAGEPGQRLRAALVEVHAVPARGVPELALPRQSRGSALRRRSPA